MLRENYTTKPIAQLLRLTDKLVNISFARTFPMLVLDSALILRENYTTLL
jgi:hypothetical protein